MNKPKFWSVMGGFVENAVTENIVLSQAMGLCPIIAAGTSLKSGVTLTVCSLVILLPLNFTVSFLGTRLPKWLRPMLYVLLSSLLLVATAFVVGHYISPEIYAHLYLFIPLLAVDTIYSRSVEHTELVSPLENLVDALGSAVGFGVIICLISLLREMAITGTVWDVPLGFPLTLPEAASPFTAFILLGFLSALLQWSKRHISASIRKKEGETS